MSCSGTNFYATDTILVLDNQFEKVEFFITDYNIPGFDIGIVEQMYMGATIKEQGDSLEFKHLSFSILLDDSFLNYEKIYNYLIERIDPKLNIFRPKKAKFQATIIVTSSKKNPIAKFVYHDVIINSIGDINLQKQSSEKVKFEVNAEYTFFEFIRIT